MLCKVSGGSDRKTHSLLLFLLSVDLRCGVVCFLSCAVTLHNAHCWILLHWLKKTAPSLSFSHGSGASFAYHMCRLRVAFTMTTTQERPVISDEEFDEGATVRVSDFNALKEMFHELKDKFESLKMEKTMEAMAQKSGDASEQMTSLQCFQGRDQARSVRHGGGNVPQQKAKAQGQRPKASKGQRPKAKRPKGQKAKSQKHKQQHKHNQDEPRWIVAQRRLSALPIPEAFVCKGISI